MATELPTMHSASYVSSTYTGDIRKLADNHQRAVASTYTDTNPQHVRRFTDNTDSFYNLISAQAVTDAMQNPSRAQNKNLESEMTKNARRYVQIFIVDPDSRVPLDKSALYEGEPFLTDLTNQELFYELEIKSILADYNSYRVTVQDKKASDKFGRDVLLEAVKIRDLAMTVVEIATF